MTRMKVRNKDERFTLAHHSGPSRWEGLSIRRLLEDGCAHHCRENGEATPEPGLDWKFQRPASSGRPPLLRGPQPPETEPPNRKQKHKTAACQGLLSDQNTILRPHRGRSETLTRLAKTQEVLLTQGPHMCMC